MVQGCKRSRHPCSGLANKAVHTHFLFAPRRVKTPALADCAAAQVYEDHHSVNLRRRAGPPDSMTRPRKLYVKSFGCQMNVYDSHRMADTLAAEGFAETANVADADLVVLNTCHIREKAEDKVFSELGRMRLLKEGAARAGRRVTIAVSGCVAQAQGEEIVRRAPSVDVVVGSQNYHRLPALLTRAERDGATV